VIAELCGMTPNTQGLAVQDQVVRRQPGDGRDELGVDLVLKQAIA
jgi:hypothetical protein